MTIPLSCFRFCLSRAHKNPKSLSLPRRGQESETCSSRLLCNTCCVPGGTVVTGGAGAQMAAQVWRCHHIKHSHQPHLNTLCGASICTHTFCIGSDDSPAMTLDSFSLCVCLFFPTSDRKPSCQQLCSVNN